MSLTDIKSIIFDLLRLRGSLAKYTQITAPYDRSADGSSLNAEFLSENCPKMQEIHLMQPRFSYEMAMRCKGILTCREPYIAYVATA